MLQDHTQLSKCIVQTLSYLNSDCILLFSVYQSVGLKYTLNSARISADHGASRPNVTQK